MLLLNFNLASAQWSDEIFLLKDISSPDAKSTRPKNKKKDLLLNVDLVSREPSQIKEINKIRPEPKSENENFNTELTNPPQVPFENFKNPLDQNTLIDIWVGEKSLSYDSNYSYQTYSGHSVLIGVSGKLNFDNNYYGNFNYQTGLYYKDASSNFKDENYSLGVVNKVTEFLSFEVSYGEHLVSHNGVTSSKTGLRVQGIPLNLFYNKLILPKANFELGVQLFPLLKVTESPTTDLAYSGNNGSGYTTGISLKFTQQQDLSEYLFLKLELANTSIKFQGQSKTFDPKNNLLVSDVILKGHESTFIIGYIWTH